MDIMHTIVGYLLVLISIGFVGFISYLMGFLLFNRMEEINQQKRLVEARHWRTRDPILERNFK